MRAAVDHFKRYELQLLAYDQDGGFSVLPHDFYAAKASEAVVKNSKPVKSEVKKFKSRAKEMCCDFNIPVLAK